MYTWTCRKCKCLCHREIAVCPICLEPVPEFDWAEDGEEPERYKVEEGKMGVRMKIYEPTLVRKPSTMDKLRAMGLDMDMDHAVRQFGNLTVDAQWTPSPGENFNTLCQRIEREIGSFDVRISRTYTELPPGERETAQTLQFFSASGAPIMLMDKEDLEE